VVCFLVPLSVNVIGDIKIQILIFLNKTKILLFLGNIESKKKAKHILEMPRLGVFCDYLNSKIKDDVQVVLLLSCFVGHPVYKILI